MLYPYIHPLCSRKSICFSLLYVLLLCLLFNPAAHAQDSASNRSKYQLLWRIDGPGIPHSSYLYGTMHLRDPRVFDFSDSVLTAFHQSKTFATELDLDSLMSYLFNPQGPVLDTTNYMRKMLDYGQYAYTDSLVKAKSGLHISQLQTKRLWYIEKLLIDQEEELAKAGNNKDAREHIFLDAWFHQKAASLNKKLAGLEGLENQTGLFAGIVPDLEKEMFLEEIGYYEQLNGSLTEWNKSRSALRGYYLDSLVNIYYSGNLETMNKWIASQEQEKKALQLMNKRNRDMTGNLIKLNKQGAVFAAVGAAHLPGTNGILALLRNKGYTVTMVPATFTGVANTYKQQYANLKGYALNRVGEGYSVTLPGMPIAYPLPGSNTFMYLSADEATNEMAFAYAISVAQMATDPGKLKEMVINGMAQKFGTQPRDVHTINYRDNEGVEGSITAQQVDYRVRVFLRNNKVYLFMHNIGSDQDTTAMQEYFNSVRMMDVSTTTMVYDTLSNQLAGFRVLFPSPYQLFNVDNKSTQSTSGRFAESYSGLDRGEQVSYSLDVMKTSPGYYNVSDQVMINQTKANLFSSDSLMQQTDSTSFTYEGHRAMDIKVRYSTGYNGWLRMIFRGNLSYLLLCQYLPASGDKAARYMNSFHLAPVSSTAPGVGFTSEDSTFTVSGPTTYTVTQSLLKADQGDYKTGMYRAGDSSLQATYLVMEQTYNPYYTNTPDSIFKQLRPPFTDSTKRVIAYHQYMQNGMYVYDVKWQHLHAGLYTTTRGVLAGRRLYYFTSIMADELETKGYAEKFISSIRFNTKLQDTSDISIARTGELLHNLHATDTTAFYTAAEALSNFEVDSTNQQQVLQTLLEPFPLDTSTINSTVKMELLRLLRRFSDTGLVQTATQLYQHSKNREEKNDLLWFISNLDEQGLQTFLTLVKDVRRQDVGDQRTFGYSVKRKPFYAKYLPEMISMAAASDDFLTYFAWHSSWDSIWKAPDYSQYGMAKLKPGLQRLFDEAWKEKEKAAFESRAYYSGINHLRTFGNLLALPTMAGGNVSRFRAMLKDSSSEIRNIGGQGLINAKGKPTTEQLRRLINDPVYGQGFISSLHDNQQLAVIKHLLSAEIVSRAAVFSYLNEDDMYVDNLQLVKKIKIPVNKQAKHFFVFKYKYQDAGEEEWQYIVSGPQPVVPGAFELSPSFIEDLKAEQVDTTDAALAATISDIYTESLQTTAENEDEE
ncbi:TraB/GumN family protein [Chitinophaga sp. MM2321]|uniref:TraB/GumN family protein n=1 Tax=Chitinophaga sp. MM2321 TaxID=3137178 RepID=UPI0032D598B3